MTSIEQLYFSHVEQTQVLDPTEEIELGKSIEDAHRSLVLGLNETSFDKLYNKMYHIASRENGSRGSVEVSLEQCEYLRELQYRLPSANGNLGQVQDLLTEFLCYDISRRFVRAASTGNCSITSALHRANEVTNTLTESNLRLASMLGKNEFYRREHTLEGMKLLDIVQHANLGLMKAVDKWDYRRGRFSTVAVWWIRSFIQRGIAAEDRRVRPSIKTNQIYQRVEEVEACWKQEHGEKPSVEEIAQEIDISEKRLREVLSVSQRWVFLDEKTKTERELQTYHDIIPGQEADPCTGTTLSLLSGEVARVLATLTPREEKILRMRTGFGEKHDLILKEVGEKLHLTAARVEQIEKVAAAKLRDSCLQAYL